MAKREKRLRDEAENQDKDQRPQVSEPRASRPSHGTNGLPPSLVYIPLDSDEDDKPLGKKKAKKERKEKRKASAAKGITATGAAGETATSAAAEAQEWFCRCRRILANCITAGADQVVAESVASWPVQVGDQKPGSFDLTAEILSAFGLKGMLGLDLDACRGYTMGLMGDGCMD